MVMELNELEQPERTLRKRPDALADIIASAMDAIIAVDDAQRIVLFNAAAEKMFSCPADEAMGNSVERFIPQRFRDGHRTRVRRFDDSGVTNRTVRGLGTLWGLRATGEEFPMEASISKVESGGEKFFTVVIRDISERHRADEAVREAEQRFRLVADTAPVLMWMSDTDKLCNYFNQPWLDFTGRSMEQELGNGWAEGVHPEDLQRCLQTYTQYFDKREEFRMEYRLRRHDGEYRWVLDIGKPRFNQDQSFAGYIGIALDVTQRRLSEEARFRLAAIVESSDDAIIAKNFDGTILSWNAAAQRLFGYTGAEVLGKPVLILVPPELVDEENENLRKASLGEPIENYETVRITKAGARTNVSLSISPIRDAIGKIVGLSSISRDINERKRTDEALRKSEERFRLAALAGKMFAYEWDAGTDVILRSSDFAKVLGEGDPVETTGKKTVARIHPDDRESVSTAIAALTPEMPNLQITYRMVRSDGTNIWVERTSQAQFDQDRRMVRIVGMLKDVTERKQAEKALRESEERLRLAQQAARIGTFEWNIKTGVNTWTPELEAIYGLPASGFDGTQTAFEKLAHPDDRARIRELVDMTLKSGQPMRGEWRVIWPDGSIHWIAGGWQVYMNESGEPSRIVGVSGDVTERKRAEEALSGMTRKLVEAQELERARIARELHDDISQRLAMLAVELEQLKENPSDVTSRVQGLRKQTREILSAVQILSHDLHSSGLEYLGVVAGMKSWCQEFGQRQKMEIDFRTCDVPNIVPSEIGLCLFRVLQEGLHNALKHSGVKRLEVQLHEGAGGIHLIISDLGKGFDVEAARQGHGLGLTSMRERVRLVGGTLSIQSKAMAGTTIHVRVPLRPDDVSQRAAV